jgi:hypothetical protein
MDVHIRNLTGLAGKGVTLVENPKSASKRDKEFFKSMVGILDSIDDRTNSLMEMGIDIVKYEDPFFQIIEGLIIKSYGHLAGGLILWWCGERKLLDAKAYNLIDEDGNTTQVSNVTQLYNYINKITK